MAGKADEQDIGLDATHDTSIDAGSHISNTYKNISSADPTEPDHLISSNALLPITLGFQLQIVSHPRRSGFLSSPTELVIYISECLHPSSILNFALTQKFFFDIAEPLLQKRRKYIETYTNVVHTDSYASARIPKLLNDIAKDPDTAYYIRHLTIRSWRHKGEYPKSSFKYTSELWTAIRRMITENDSIPDDEKAEWISSAEKHGDQEPLVALLLLQLTHVMTITIECPWRIPLTMLPETVQSIARSGYHTALRRLHTVTLDFPGYGGPSPMFTAFAGVRSVRSLHRTPYPDGETEEEDWA